MKQKSHSGTKKRVKITGNNKLMMQKANKNHLLANKSKRQKKLDTKGAAVDQTNLRKLKKLLSNVS